MEDPLQPTDPIAEDTPILGSWARLYWVVLFLHALTIGLFYWFMQAYS